MCSRIGEGGGSNFTFALERGGERFVLRRPPRPPYPPSTHDVVREARFQLALRRAAVRLPEIVAVCDDPSVIGVPFYVTRYIDGYVIGNRLPSGLASHESRRRLIFDLVDALAEIHSADVSQPELAEFLRPGSYLERQLRRFDSLWQLNQTRPIEDLDRAGAALAASMPGPSAISVVHGDYRVGNVIVDRHNPCRVAAVIDWEMATLGDPRADLGYLVAMYSEPGRRPSPLGLSPVTQSEGFPSRESLVGRYREQTGTEVEPLGWFMAFAWWKAAIFCEGIYGRFVRGELESADRSAARFESAVPRLAAAALERISE